MNLFTQNPVTSTVSAMEPNPRSPHPLDLLRDRHSKLGHGGYVWIPNVGKVEGGSIQIIPGLLRIASADADETGELRQLLRYNQARLQPRNPWETATSARPGETPGCMHITWSPLEDGCLRYILLHHTDPTGNSVHQLVAASVLSSGPVFERGYGVIRETQLEGGGMFPFGVMSSPTVDRILKEQAICEDGFLSDFTTQDAEDLAKAFALMTDPAKSPYVGRAETAARDFISLLEVPRRELRILGYFTLIESLLTHKPEPEDRHQSLIRQIKKKLTLVGHRFERQLRYSDFVDPSMHVDRIWERMYDLRSLIAHGEKPTLESGGLASLRSIENAEALAASAARSLIRQYLEEPVLMTDLQDC